MTQQKRSNVYFRGRRITRTNLVICMNIPCFITSLPYETRQVLDKVL